MTKFTNKDLNINTPISLELQKIATRNHLEMV